MTIAPVRTSVTLKAPPARAFALFVERIGEWWPKGHSIGKAPPVAIVIESPPGRRFFERDAEGRETEWGRVLAWEPPGRLVLAWQLTGEWVFDPLFLTEVEVTFAPRGEGTEVTLEHRNLDRFGTRAAGMAESLGKGWAGILAGYAVHADGVPA